MKKAIYLGIVTVFLVLLILCTTQKADNNEMSITTSSKEAMELFLEGREKFELAEGDAAAELFDQATALDPDFALAYYYRAYTIGGFNVWRENIEKAMSLSDKVTEGEKLFITFGKAWGEGNAPKAIENIEKLMGLYPLDKRILFNAGAFYADAKSDFEKALQLYEQTLEIDQDFAPAYNFMGGAYAALDNLDAAENAYKKYVELVPNNPDPYDSLAWLLRDKGKYEESIEQYKKAYELDPSYIWAFRGIGHNFTFKGDHTKAREAYQRMYDEAPNINAKFNSFFWKSVSYLHEGNVEEALKALDEYSALAEEDNNIPGVIYPLRLKGFIHTEMGKLKEGLEFYEKAVDLVLKSDLPDEVRENHLLYNAQNMLYALSANKDFEAAEAEAAKCLEMIEQKDVEGWRQNIHGTLGYHYLMKEDYDSALENFSKSNPFNMWTTYYRAVAHEKKGEIEEAMTFYEKVAETNRNGFGLALIRSKAQEKVKE